ncbi:hypothetical protein M422DRAFT_277215 [Sphaerobolus stellatus SS14]|uniref:Uncharacterized protein n=1 Tax=Sphaerobolus stellatus (strain SS14) TaxID=990650 RepID=A0A0C9UB86_SPHS4|nr:hypothetical protein M422DRAFT_277215 [Sphaerobolus stellatus SS14]
MKTLLSTIPPRLHEQVIQFIKKKIKAKCTNLQAHHTYLTSFGHVTFIPPDEIKVALLFLDNIPILGPNTRYEQEDGTYEIISENPGI